MTDPLVEFDKAFAKALFEQEDEMMRGAELSEQSARASQYASDIRGIARILWRGAIDDVQAYGLLRDTVRIGLTRAGHEGAAECGITPAELSLEEKAAINQAISSEHGFILGLIDAVIAGSKANGGKFSAFASRLAQWGTRYQDVANEIKVTACGDQKLEWVHNALGITKDPCDTCKNKLAGKVKRASYWRKMGVRPQNVPNPFLDCEGWGCLCDLVPTDKPLSRGPLPKLP